jgi:hypothetical protein
MKSFRIVSPVVSTLVIMSLSLMGARGGYAADSTQLEKDQKLLQKYEQLQLEKAKILEASRATENKLAGVSLSPLSIPLRAVRATYSSVTGVQSAFSGSSTLGGKALAAGVSTIAGAMGACVGACAIPFALAYAPYEGYHYLKSRKINNKLKAIEAELDQYSSEAVRIQSKDTPLTWSIKKNNSWENTQQHIDHGADFSDQDAQNGPLQSAASIAKSKFSKYVDYMIGHEKKVSQHIAQVLDLVCVSSETDLMTGSNIKIKAPMDVINIMTSYVSDEVQLKRKGAVPKTF